MSPEDGGPFVFRLNDNGIGPNLLIQVCIERGWKEYDYNSSSLKENWNLWWKTSAFPVSQHRQLKPWQFTNHIPKGASICRKDHLARRLKCMKKVYGGIYDITPQAYNLPLDYTKFVADCSRHGEEKRIWICKPVGQSQGRGIFLFKDLSDLCYDSNAVIQKYIPNPLLIGGYKFDLRLYVCVPSYHPLTIYLYKEGIVRFSTEKFSLNDLSNPFCHLTNSSLNKLGPGYSDQKGGIGAGCKWSLKQLRKHFEQIGIRDWLIWQKIAALVTLTVLSQSNSVPQTTNCFEFYGFDILIDDRLKPWLLEVNLSPALGIDCDVDPIIKKPLLHDLFDLLGLPVCNTGLSLYSSTLPDILSTITISNYENSEASETKVTNTSRRSSASTSALLVAAAATRWRRKHRAGYFFGPPHTSALYPLSDERNRGRINSGIKKAESVPLFPLENSRIARKQSSTIKREWGNGRNWKYPANSEGDWVRIHPLCVQEQQDDFIDMKLKVNQITKFVRTAKLIFSENNSSSDHALSNELSSILRLTTDPWLPPK